MALSHTAFIRGFNSIYQQAPRVPTPDKADFRAPLPHPELLSITESFQDALHAHFVSEPAAIAALARHSTSERPIDILGIAHLATRKQISLGLVFNALPVFYLNMNHAEFEGGVWDGIFPSFKGTGRALLTRGIPMWHTRRWRFASCTPDGRLK
ncbi:uncharacterized protein PG998_011488 [Apiospora kogelbergensis]|uniref:uncharacterized protein n=1 Tax=Apiospora kogelbergensis TaxID=1337665 RepID=UPI00312DDC66